jgi:hypothetical protein
MFLRNIEQHVVADYHGYIDIYSGQPINLPPLFPSQPSPNSIDHSHMMDTSGIYVNQSNVGGNDEGNSKKNGISHGCYEIDHIFERQLLSYAMLTTKSIPRRILLYLDHKNYQSTSGPTDPAELIYGSTSKLPYITHMTRINSFMGSIKQLSNQFGNFSITTNYINTVKGRAWTEFLQFERDLMFSESDRCDLTGEVTTLRQLLVSKFSDKGYSNAFIVSHNIINSFRSVYYHFLTKLDEVGLTVANSSMNICELFDCPVAPTSEGKQYEQPSSSDAIFNSMSSPNRTRGEFIKSTGYLYDLTSRIEEIVMKSGVLSEEIA